MEQQVTEALPLRLLLNAEPFGFGPAAAIAGFFPHLRDRFQTIGYMGKKHTLDLQRGLSYDAVHDITDVPENKRTEVYATIFSQYDILFTAMDSEVAEFARAAGLKVFYYDALAWYWSEIPESVLKSDLYLAQNFFGVEERLKDAFARHAHAHAVAPIAPEPQQNQKKEHVLINLGGLQNPYWPIAGVIEYARAVIDCILTAIPPSESIVITCSQAVSSALSDKGVMTCPREDMEDILERSKVAFMTPGLGNIYDVGAYDIPTVWLPPANDSQAQQLVLIESYGMSDATLYWSDIYPGANINYSDPQSTVLSQIAATATSLSRDPEARNRLSELARKHYEAVSGKTGSNTSKIIENFGNGGECEVARLVVERARGYAHG